MWNNLSRYGIRLLCKSWATHTDEQLFSLPCLPSGAQNSKYFIDISHVFHRHFPGTSLYFEVKKEITYALSLPAISRRVLLARTLEQSTTYLENPSQVFIWYLSSGTQDSEVLYFRWR